jgi:ubiquinol-cytochrome c reductase cytochrome b subunit
MFSAIIILFFLPWLDSSPVRSGRYRPMFKIFFGLFILDVVLLGYIGGQLPVQPYIILGQLATLYYFAYFLVILPLLGKFEKPLPLPESISASYKK